MQDAPDNTELLDAVADFLRRDVVSALDGSLQYRVRVAAHVVDRVKRGLEQPPSVQHEECARLQALFGTGGDVPTLTRMLCDRIAAGESTLDTPGLGDFLWWVTCRKLAVDQPRYAGYRRAIERGQGAAADDL